MTSSAADVTFERAVNTANEETSAARTERGSNQVKRRDGRMMAVVADRYGSLDVLRYESVEKRHSSNYYIHPPDQEFNCGINIYWA